MSEEEQAAEILQSILGGKDDIMRVGTALLPFVAMLNCKEDSPQARFDVDLFEENKDRFIITTFWGKFIVTRLGDVEDLKDAWGAQIPFECTEHDDVHWIPVPLISSLQHVLHFGLTTTLDRYMAKQIEIPVGSTLN